MAPVASPVRLDHNPAAATGKVLTKLPTDARAEHLGDAGEFRLGHPLRVDRPPRKRV